MEKYGSVNVPLLTDVGDYPPERSLPPWKKLSIALVLIGLVVVAAFWHFTPANYNRIEHDVEPDIVLSPNSKKGHHGHGGKHDKSHKTTAKPVFEYELTIGTCNTQFASSDKAIKFGIVNGDNIFHPAVYFNIVPPPPGKKKTYRHKVTEKIGPLYVMMVSNPSRDPWCGDTLTVRDLTTHQYFDFSKSLNGGTWITKECAPWKFPYPPNGACSANQLVTRDWTYELRITTCSFLNSASSAKISFYINGENTYSLVRAIPAGEGKSKVVHFSSVHYLGQIVSVHITTQSPNKWCLLKMNVVSLSNTKNKVARFTKHLFGGTWFQNPCDGYIFQGSGQCYRELTVNAD